MKEQKGLATILTEVLYKPYSSVALMGAIGLLGISSGFITYQDSAQTTVPSQTLDTALPAMSPKVFKNNKYDNASLMPAEQDSILLPDLLQPETITESVASTTVNRPVDNGFATNEHLIGQTKKPNEASFSNGTATWKNRNNVRSHYNQRLNDHTYANQQTILQMTTPAPLSAQELADRQSREASLARAAQLEEMALSQLEKAQNSQGTMASSTIPGRVAGNVTASKYNLSTDAYPDQNGSSLPPAQVTLANLDEYVEVPDGRQPQNVFYGLKGERKQPEMISAKPVPNAIEAVIHGDADQVTVTNGSTIKLRLLQDIQAITCYPGILCFPENA